MTMTMTMMKTSLSQKNHIGKAGFSGAFTHSFWGASSPLKGGAGYGFCYPVYDTHRASILKTRTVLLGRYPVFDQYRTQKYAKC